MSNKEKYIELCKTNSEINLFAKPWWLDTTAGEENWDVCFVEKGGNFFAAMPYVRGSVQFFKGVEISPLSPRTHLFINYPKGQKLPKKYSFEKEIITKIIDQLPDVDYYTLKFNYDLDNWLPFYWRNFKQQTNYSYIIEEISDLDLVFSNFGSNIKTDIKKAQKNVNVHSNYSLEKLPENKRCDKLVDLDKVRSKYYERQDELNKEASILQQDVISLKKQRADIKFKQNKFAKEIDEDMNDYEYYYNKVLAIIKEGSIDAMIESSNLSLVDNNYRYIVWSILAITLLMFMMSFKKKAISKQLT